MCVSKPWTVCHCVQPKLQGTLKTVPEKADWANKGLEMELERSAGLVLPESRGSIRGRQRGR